MSVPVLAHFFLCIPTEDACGWKRRNYCSNQGVLVAVFSGWKIQMIVQDFVMRIFRVHLQEKTETLHAKILLSKGIIIII